jgi:hypothetical protein
MNWTALGLWALDTLAIMMTRKKPEHCQICGRVLDNPADPLSINCGGDCWGCVGEAEADGGDPESLAMVRKESKAGLRPSWVDPVKR